MPQFPSVTDSAVGRPRWFALRVRSNRERQAQRDLQLAAIPEFLPLYIYESRWSDRTKTTERPLFPGYVFIHGRAAELELAIRTRDVLQIVGLVSDKELESVKRLTESRMKIEPCSFAVGETVTVESGALAGSSGVITRTKGARRLIVTLQLLNRAVGVELDADTVTSGNKKESKAA